MNQRYDEFLDLVKNGTEEEVTEFLKAHLNEFPEDLQQKILFAYFEDEVNRQSDEFHALEDVKRSGLEVLKKLEAIKKEMEEAQKIHDLEESLNKTAQ